MALAAMSEAIERAEVMLFTLCQEYKESANCRLEGEKQYAVDGVNFRMISDRLLAFNF